MHLSRRVIPRHQQWSAVSHVLLLAAVLTACARADTTPPPLTQTQQEQVFDEAIHILGGNVNVISKWVDDIQLSIIGQASAQSAALAQAIVMEIATQTRLSLVSNQPAIGSADAYLAAVEQPLNFRRAACNAGTPSAGDVRRPAPVSPGVETGNAEKAMTALDRRTTELLCANFVVIFSDVETMRKLATAIPLRPVYQRSLLDADAVNCFFSPSVNQKMEITQAFVFVREDLPEPMLRTCLYEEIYQSFGLFNDFDGSQYYSFNNVVAPKEITRFDRALLASVYDPQFRPGAPAFRVVTRLMSILQLDQYRR